MRQLSRSEHDLGVFIGRPGESGIQGERRGSSLHARLVGQGEKLLFGLKLFVDKRNVGSRGSDRMQFAFLRRTGNG